MIYFDLLLGFLKVGFFAFGGAYGAIPLIRDVVLAYEWMDEEMLAYMIAVSESTPGPIVVNLATYVGNTQAGLPGAILATLAVVMPSFIIIYLISRFLDNFLDIGFVASAFWGMKVGVGIVIVNAGLNMLKKTPKNAFSRGCVIFGLAAMLTVNLFALDFSAIALMLMAGFVSLAVSLIKGGAAK